MRNLFAKVVTIVMISVFSVSCGQNGGGVLSGVNVSTTTSANNEIMLSLSANINLGAMSFAAISLPIINPKGSNQIGTVELVPGLGGVNMIKISVNMSELVGYQSSQAVLPNGNAIPLIANNQTIAVNLGKGAKLYLTISGNVTAIGVAVPISAFDSIGAKLPGLNFFPVVAFDKVIATAGIFTGANAGQNGIALVADVSQIVKLDNILSRSSSSAVASKSRSAMRTKALVVREAAPANDDIQLNYDSQKPSAAKEAKLKSMLLQMNAKKTVLRMHK